MRKDLTLEKLVEIPIFSLHHSHKKHNNLWFYSYMDGPTKAYEVNLKDLSFKSFHERLDLDIKTNFMWLEENKFENFFIRIVYNKF